MPVADHLLQLTQVVKRYPSAADAEGPPVLNGVDLQIDEGASVAITGPSGCGKTTLLNLIGTLDKPDQGSVLLEGEDLTQLSGSALAKVRNRRIGFVFQLHHLLPQCTVLENVLLPVLANENEVQRDGAPDRARRLLERVGLKDRANYRPGQLSGGERQRAAVVRALINEPPLLLADEPTGSLDRVATENLGKLLVELNRETGVTLIVVTHAPELAKRMAGVQELRDGTLRAAGQQ